MWLGLIPFGETVRGGPGYAKELTEVLVAVGVLRQGVRAHKAHLAQLGEEYFLPLPPLPSITGQIHAKT